MSDQGALFDAGPSEARSTASECPACGGVLESAPERREGRCRRCIASGVEALTLDVDHGPLLEVIGPYGRVGRMYADGTPA